MNAWIEAGMMWLGAWDQAGRFLRLEDAFVRAAVAGGILLGINCGLLGSFLVVRRMALAGDTLAHAILPGIVGGYLWNLTKDPTALLVGAILAGVLGSLLMNAITATTKLRADAAQGIVLTVFFALGVCLISLLPQGNKAGVDKFLFGQLAAVDAQDLNWLVKATALTILVIVVFYRGLLVLSFDPTFGRLSRLPMRLLHYGLMLLTTLAIVVAMEAVGVVLVSALLVIPASAASLLTDRFGKLLVISALFGMAAAVAGSFFSFVGTRLAAGPMVVICAAGLFALAFLFSPQHGVYRKWKDTRRWNRRVEVENWLKRIFRYLEDRRQAVADVVDLPAFVAQYNFNRSHWQKGYRRLREAELIESVSDHEFRLSEKGQTESRRVVRHHRLWELYLASRASYALDHVHEDAEAMEHLMTEEQAARMAELLGNPQQDPHGRSIP
jgi:ABC-type Mn2+/Zn2+ transport system permease subunit/Mn-dependent DtxR family transcriptional regulator